MTDVHYGRDAFRALGELPISSTATRAALVNLPDPEVAWAIDQTSDDWRGAYAYLDMVGIRVAVEDDQSDDAAHRHLTPDEARALAAWLLAAARHIEESR